MLNSTQGPLHRNILRSTQHNGRAMIALQKKGSHQKQVCRQESDPNKCQGRIVANKKLTMSSNDFWLAVNHSASRPRIGIQIPSYREYPRLAQ